MIRLDRLLSSRGYCSRSEASKFIKDGRILIAGEQPKNSSMRVDPDLVTFDGEKLDPGEGLLFMMNKPLGYVCSHKELAPLVFELLPQRYNNRNPKVVSIGRLDKDTTGLLLLTDDGALVHRLTNPKKKVEKVYEVVLDRELNGTEGEVFASGTLLLEGEEFPLSPAKLEVTSPTTARITIIEGRYHQVRRMFAAVGNHVNELKRIRIGNLELGDLELGQYKPITLDQIIDRREDTKNS